MVLLDHHWMLSLLLVVPWFTNSIIGVIGLLKKDFILIILSYFLLMPTSETTIFGLPNAKSQRLSHSWWHEIILKSIYFRYWGIRDNRAHWNTIYLRNIW